MILQGDGTKLDRQAWSQQERYPPWLVGPVSIREHCAVGLSSPQMPLFGSPQVRGQQQSARQPVSPRQHLHQLSSAGLPSVSAPCSHPLVLVNWPFIFFPTLLVTQRHIREHPKQLACLLGDHGVGSPVTASVIPHNRSAAACSLLASEDPQSWLRVSGQLGNLVNSTKLLPAWLRLQGTERMHSGMHHVSHTRARTRAHTHTEAG